MRGITRWLTPFADVPRHHYPLMVLLWLVMTVGCWQFTAGPITPTPLQVLAALSKLADIEVVRALATSFVLNLEALLIAASLSITLSFLSVVPLFRMPAQVFSALRFVGIGGLTYFFTRWTSGGHSLKVWLLVFPLTAFYHTSLLGVVSSVSAEDIEYGRSLGLSPWRLLYELVARGKLHETLSMLRQNAANGWSMLTMVEVVSRQEGGVGVLLANASRFTRLDTILAIQLAVLVLGLIFDYTLGLLNRCLCPYACMRGSHGGKHGS